MPSSKKTEPETCTHSPAETLRTSLRSRLVAMQNALSHELRMGPPVLNADDWPKQKSVQACIDASNEARLAPQKIFDKLLGDIDQLADIVADPGVVPHSVLEASLNLRGGWLHFLRSLQAAIVAFLATAKELLPAANKALAQAESSLAKAIETVGQQLRDVGISPESMRSYTSNPRAAEIEFQNSHVAKAAAVRAARDQVTQRKALRDTLLEQRREQRQLLDEVATQIQRRIAELLGFQAS